MTLKVILLQFCKDDKCYNKIYSNDSSIENSYTQTLQAVKPKPFVPLTSLKIQTGSFPTYLGSLSNEKPRQKTSKHAHHKNW